MSIVVIDGGNIVEMGSHAELLRRRGHCYRLYTRQFRQELELEFDPFLFTSLTHVPAKG